MIGRYEMLLIIFLVAIVVLFFVFEAACDADGAGIFFGMAVLCVTSFAWVVIYPYSMSRSAELSAFHNANEAHYKQTVEATKNATLNLEPSTYALADLPHMQEGIEVAQRVKEHRDAIVEYNKALSRRRIFDKNIAV